MFKPLALKPSFTPSLQLFFKWESWMWKRQCLHAEGGARMLQSEGSSELWCRHTACKTVTECIIVSFSFFGLPYLSESLLVRQRKIHIHKHVCTGFPHYVMSYFCQYLCAMYCTFTASKQRSLENVLKIHTRNLVLIASLDSLQPPCAWNVSTAESKGYLWLLNFARDLRKKHTKIALKNVKDWNNGKFLLYKNSILHTF